MSTHLAESVADAVLYEGYVLYPYRASSAKNRWRWQVGLVTPRGYAEATGADPWFAQTECLAEIDPGATLDIRVRGLHVQARSVEAPAADGAWGEVDRLRVAGRELLPWDEAVVAEARYEGLPLDAAPRRWQWTWTLDGDDAHEEVRDEAGRLAARFVRRRAPVACAVLAAIEPCGRALRIRLRVENLTPCGAATVAEREEAVRRSLAGAHAILRIAGGRFISLLEPPADLAEAAAACENRHTFPVLAGDAGARDVILSSPIILYDYPAVAPESPGDLFDATEIDELLMLRVQTLTPDEKREALATDPRAAEIVERCDAASAGTMNRLHGAVRHLAPAADPLAGWESFLNPPGEPAPDAAAVEAGGTLLRRGSRVRLEPTRHADSMDLCLRGRLATVSAVYRTLEDAPYVAVVLDDDPFGAAGAAYRRALFFHPDEIVPLDGAEGPA